MQIKEDRKNSLLHRQEVIALVENQMTLSKQEAIKAISEHFKKSEETVVIEKIDSLFGTKKTIITARVYDSPESRKKMEVIPRKVKKKLAKEAAEAKKE
ncbi:MAG: hypothetical protein WC796_05015 [Candidatus Pacearchaeota archaeon]|jgi:ribosomal protein S24E